MDTTTPIDTREEMADNSLVAFQHWGKTVEKRAGGLAAPNTVSSLVRTREYLTGREIERLMAAARKSSRYGHRDATMIPDRLPPRLAGVRVVRSAMVAGRAGHGPATRPQGEERLAAPPVRVDVK
jgi:hypothetical protein